MIIKPSIKVNILKSLLHFCDVLFLLTLIILPISWILDPLLVDSGPIYLRISWGLKPVLIPIVLLIIRIAIRTASVKSDNTASGILDKGIVRKGLLSVVTMYIGIALLEWCLVLTNFEIQMAPVIFSIKDESGEVSEHRGYEDPELRWTFHIGEDYYGMRINSLGYRDREVKAEKRDGVLRVVNMGDSCTADGYPPYSTMLNDLLVADSPNSKEWEAFNMAVYGYTSYQGLRVFQTQTKELDPDIVTLYFGWNDHWLEMETDRNRMAVSTSPLYGKIYNLLKKKRLFMMLVKLQNGRQDFDAVRTELGCRVPPEEYRSVIAEFISEIRSVGAYPIVITAPRRDSNTHQDKYGTGIDYNATHDEYVQITREVALKHNADLLDLYQILEPEEYNSYFKDDGIHLTQPGLKFIAEQIDTKIRAMVKTKEMGLSSL